MQTLNFNSLTYFCQQYVFYTLFGQNVNFVAVAARWRYVLRSISLQYNH